MNQEQVDELLLQALAQERAAVRVYQTALRCVVHPDLRAEWRACLATIRRREVALEHAVVKLGLDPERQTACREVVTALGEALVRGMSIAKDSGDRPTAQLMACECVSLTETRLQSNRELLSRVVSHAEGELQGALRPAVAELESTDDEHLIQARNWSRELWNQALGLEARLPPAEDGSHGAVPGAVRESALSDAH